MGAIDKLAKKLGFVRLDKYGLVHTPDDRILSTRPAVLDDGVGGKIVGWLESDLAAMELERHGAPKQAPPRKIELPKPAAVISPVPQPKPLPGVTPMAAAPAPVPVPAPAPIPAPAPVVVAQAPAPVVAPEPVVEEDEWEWEIAVARARAEAAPAPKTEESWDQPVKTFGRAPKITQQPVLAAQKERVTFTPVAQPAPQPAPAAKMFTMSTTPGTVIPVPALPTAADPRQIRPVVAAPKRFPKATAKHEDTIVTHAAPPANDDKTQPSISLPRAASTVGLPSAKRVAAKQR